MNEQQRQIPLPELAQLALIVSRRQYLGLQLIFADVKIEHLDGGLEIRK